MNKLANNTKSNNGVTSSVVKTDGATNKSSPGASSNRDQKARAGGGARPKPVFFWTNLDVLKWLKRHCAELFTHYCHLFEQHDITGRSLVRMTDNNLERLGISDASHRDEIWREILKLKLKCDILELRDLQNKSGNLTAN